MSLLLNTLPSTETCKQDFIGFISTQQLFIGWYKQYIGKAYLLLGRALQWGMQWGCGVLLRPCTLDSYHLSGEALAFIAAYDAAIIGLAEFLSSSSLWFCLTFLYFSMIINYCALYIFTSVSVLAVGALEVQVLFSILVKPLIYQALENIIFGTKIAFD